MSAPHWPTSRAAQDLLTYSLKGLACWANFARRQGVEVPQEAYSLLNAATFATLTNVNFDDDRFKVGGGGWARSSLDPAKTLAGVALYSANSRIALCPGPLSSSFDLHLLPAHPLAALPTCLLLLYLVPYPRSTSSAATPCATSWRQRCGPRAPRPRPPPPSCPGLTCWRTPRRECTAPPWRATAEWRRGSGECHVRYV